MHILTLSKATPKPFEIYDDTHNSYPTKPQLTFPKIKLFYQWDLITDPTATSMPDFPKMEQAAATLPVDYNGVIVLDIEMWPVYTDKSLLGRFETVFDFFKGRFPNATIGYYGIFPDRSIFECLFPRAAFQYTVWQKRNDVVAPLAYKMDAFFPSLYTMYEDQDRWEIYCKANVEEARRYALGKPVIPFIWPLYHGAAFPIPLRLQMIPTDYMRHQIECCYKYADGVVIWQDNGNYAWSNDTPWYKAATDFEAETKVESSDVYVKLAADSLRIKTDL
jgi:hypothetical protein